MTLEVIDESTEWKGRQTLMVNGEEYEKIQDLSECPEDAIIGRDLIDAYNLINYIKLGYEAGKNGEELIIL